MNTKGINPIGVLGFAGLVLTGCAIDGGAPYQGFEGPSQPAGGFATVKPVTFDDGAGFLRRTHLELAIYAFADEDMKVTKIASPSSARFGRPLLLLPGTYRIGTICYSCPVEAMMSMTLAVQAGNTYEIMCKPMALPQVTVELVNTYATASAPMPEPAQYQDP